MELWYRHSGEPEINGVPLSFRLKTVNDLFTLKRELCGQNITHMYVKRGDLPSLVTLMLSITHLKLHSIEGLSQLFG